MKGEGCRVQSAGCRVQGAGCRVQGAGCRVQGAGCRVWGVGCRVQGTWYNPAASSSTISTVPFHHMSNWHCVSGFMVKKNLLMQKNDLLDTAFRLSWSKYTNGPKTISAAVLYRHCSHGVGAYWC